MENLYYSTLPFFLFRNPAAYITHNATQRLSDIARDLLDYQLLSLEKCTAFTRDKEIWRRFPFRHRSVYHLTCVARSV